MTGFFDIQIEFRTKPNCVEMASRIEWNFFLKIDTIIWSTTSIKLHSTTKRYWKLVVYFTRNKVKQTTWVNTSLSLSWPIGVKFYKTYSQGWTEMKYLPNELEWWLLPIKYNKSPFACPMEEILCTKPMSSEHTRLGEKCQPHGKLLRIFSGCGRISQTHVTKVTWIKQGSIEHESYI